MHFVLKLSLVLVVVLATGCSSARRYGSSRMDYLSEEVAETTPAPEMKSDLVRGGSSAGAYFEAVPQTTAYARIKARAAIAEVVYKTKMTWDKEEPLLNAADKSAIESTRKQSCFDVHVKADSIAANDPSGWIATLESDGKQLVGKFGEFKGFESTTYTAAYGIVSSSTQYFLYSTLCFRSAIPFQKPFSLVVEPRFERNYPPIKLEWREPRKV